MSEKSNMPVVKVLNEKLKCGCGCGLWHFNGLPYWGTRNMEQATFIHVHCYECGKAHALLGEKGSWMFCSNNDIRNYYFPCLK